MKIVNIIASIVAAASMFFIAGCGESDTLPTVEKMTSISTVIGKTAGYACELAKTKTAVKEGIMTVLDAVAKIVPDEGKTFTEAWSTTITEELQKLVDAKKIGSTETTLVKAALTAATEGIDYVFTKYPKAKEVKELVSATVDGFIAGYKSVASTAAGAKPEIDEAAYNYIKSKMQATK